MSRVARAVYVINKIRWRLTRPITLGVRLILERDGCVVLVKHTYQEHWYLPGGGVCRGETLEQAVRREAAEELGASLGPLHLFGVYSNFYEHKHDHVVVFWCDQFTLTGKTDREIERFHFFPPEALPESTAPGTRRRIEEFDAGGGGAVGGLW